jgi:hypothetical protein
MITIVLHDIKYGILIEKKKHLYNKIRIFEGLEEVTAAIFKNTNLLDKLIKKVNKTTPEHAFSIPADHHLIPQKILKNWSDPENNFNSIVLNKINNEKLIKKEYNKNMNNLTNKFSSLHSYTFLFDNIIVIFEGNFINFIEEKFIHKIIDYLIEPRLNKDNNIKDIFVNKINFTETMLDGMQFSCDKKIENPNDMKLIYLYSLVLHSYSRLDKSKKDLDLTFSKIYQTFESQLNDLTLVESLSIYFQAVCEQSQKLIQEELTSLFRFDIITAPENFDFIITENWIFAAGDTLKNLENILIPLSPKYAVLLSKDPETMKTFRDRLKQNNNLIIAILNQEMIFLDELKVKEYYDDKTKQRKENYETRILLTKKNINIINEYLDGTIDKNNYLDDAYTNTFPEANGMIRIDFLKSKLIDLTLIYK